MMHKGQKGFVGNFSIKPSSINKFNRIDDFADLRKNKSAYKNIPITEKNEIYHEALEGIHSFGVAGQSYYSRPNDATGVAIDEVPYEPMLRTTVVRKLVEINQHLNSPEMTSIFGGAVELYVEEGVRLPSVQRKLHDEVFPFLIKQNKPDINEVEMSRVRANLIANPSIDSSSPSPHMTGGAFDITLRYRQDSRFYKPNVDVFLRDSPISVSDENFPDYYESLSIKTIKQQQIKENRRAFYAIMSGRAFGFDTELACNPTEWWHWSYGDQLWAYVRGNPHALYSLV